MKRWILLAVCVAGLIGAPRPVAAKPLKVVTTLSTFADLVQTIGGDRVEVAAIAPPQFNPHFIEPKPSDVLKVKRADLFVHAGLDLELWRGPLLDAAGNLEVMPGRPGELDLSQGVTLLEVPNRAVSRAEGDIHLYGNPHYWLDPDNAIVMCLAIAKKLSALDPDHADSYDFRARAFTRNLANHTDEWKQRAVGLQDREAVAYHNEWPYLARFLEIHIEQFLEPRPGIPPTPKQLGFLEEYMRQHRIRAILQATSVPRQAADTLAKRTGARVVLLCQSVRELEACADYLSMLNYNVAQLVSALSE